MPTAVCSTVMVQSFTRLRCCMNAPETRRWKGKMNMIGNETALPSMPKINFLFQKVCESLRLRVWFWFIIAPV